MSKRNTILSIITTAAQNISLIKITLGNKRPTNTLTKNVFIKPIVVKEALLLSFVYRHATNDITKNANINESITLIENLLQTDFFNADIYTNTQTIYYSNTADDKEKISIKNIENIIASPSLNHDKQKQRIVNAHAIYLQQLGISSAEGNIKKEMQHKFKQINRYVEIIEGIIKNQPLQNNFTVVDMGSGKGYLTFALYDYLLQKNGTVKVLGIEQRDDLVNKCNNIAALSTCHGLQFIKGSISDYNLPAVDMLIALHACDTATDDAIAKGIKANAQYIIVAPCCHKQIRKQIAPTNALKNITQHGILLERQAEMLTDTIRALLLEAHGYKTKVFDFIEAEHTPKNVMIAAVKSTFSQNLFEENMQKVTALKEMFGVREHYLERVM